MASLEWRSLGDRLDASEHGAVIDRVIEHVVVGGGDDISMDVDVELVGLAAILLLGQCTTDAHQAQTAKLDDGAHQSSSGSATPPSSISSSAVWANASTGTSEDGSQRSTIATSSRAT